MNSLTIVLCLAILAVIITLLAKYKSREHVLLFRVPFVPARWAPLFVRNFFIWLQAQRDGKFGLFGRLDVVLRWLGRQIVWDPVKNPIHQHIEHLLKPNEVAVKLDKERQDVEKQLAKLHSFWVLLSLLVLFFIADLLGDVQLIKTLGIDGVRRVLIAFAIAAVLFSLPVLAVKFYTKKTKHWFWLVMGLLSVIVFVIATIQLSETAAAPDRFALQDGAAGLLLSIAVVGPALLAKFLLNALFPVWEKRKEHQRLLRELHKANRLHRMAQRYMEAFQRYREWYASHAAQIASVYRRAFARKFLAVHQKPDVLKQMLDDDSLKQLDDATEHPERITIANNDQREHEQPRRTADVAKELADFTAKVRKETRSRRDIANPYQDKAS